MSLSLIQLSADSRGHARPIMLAIVTRQTYSKIWSLDDKFSCSMKTFWNLDESLNF